MRRLAALLAGLALLGLAAIGLDRAFPPELARLHATGRVVTDRAGRTVAVLPAPGGIWRLPTTPDDVAPVLIDTLLATEDRGFHAHLGVDPMALLRAAWEDARAGRIVAGGSTLTMQVARLLHPRPRTMRAKLIEIARAMQLEAHFSKAQILSMWLTLAPFGGNLEGVRAASLAWFGIEPRLLDAAQAALLVAIPRRPEALRPDRHAARARALRDRILGADGGAVPTHRHSMPRHAAQALAGLGGGARIATTLDLPLQSALERLAAERRRTLQHLAAIAVLVADLHGNLRAVVTSGDTALDLTRAIRSPGSALKPFVYAMTFQDGIAGPETRLADLPRHFGGYAPENFDHGFTGPITAAEALQRSLNLPAVALMRRVGPARFAAAIRAAGVTLRLPPGADASLPLALGGAGISLREAAGLYEAIAGDGRTAMLRLDAARPVPRAAFVSADVAASIARILTRPFPAGGPPGIAWKTGTSWGGRDAWALGFDRRHVVGIWVGRPDGTPLPGATGAALALPLLASVFDVLPPAPRPMPAELAAAPVHHLHADALRLLFPPPGAVLDGRGRIVLRAMGGQRPLRFLIDGMPLATDPARRDIAWRPPAPGFYRLTILDADGAAAHAAVRVK
ncbi:MAG: penicillin-binding protein 1C [Rhodospirillales bacterium]|nr:penicillin-binding protein 1C [Rhodospirillales bacterium]MDE2575518.1 penicillin-binding protein 1C [Rhodospirillales bacterium]